MNKKVVTFISFFVILGFALSLLFPLNTNAGIIDEIEKQAGDFGRTLGLPDQAQDPIQIVGKVITYLLGFLGVVFLLLIVWAGFTWMISQGDETKVKKARKIIGASVMGLVVIILSLAIVQFVIIILRQAQL